MSAERPANDLSLGGARRDRELATIVAMLQLYCAAQHAPRGAGLCAECAALAGYARRRLARCAFGESKPTCAKCTVHCYSAGMREQVRQVMRWAGPRMLWRHPLLALHHLIDGRRPAPPLDGAELKASPPAAADSECCRRSPARRR